jgi:hypothetical protein
MTVSLSALRAGGLLHPPPPRKILGINFCQRLSRHQGHSAAGWIRSIGKSSDLIGNRTRDLPARSKVPQSTKLPLFIRGISGNATTFQKINILRRLIATGISGNDFWTTRSSSRGKLQPYLTDWYYLLAIVRFLSDTMRETMDTKGKESHENRDENKWTEDWRHESIDPY